MRAQNLGRADTGQHQQLGRIDGAGAYQHFARCGDATHLRSIEDVHPDRPVVVEHDAQGPRLRDHVQIAPRHRRPQIGIRGVAANTVADRQVVQAGTVAPLAVEVLVAVVSASHCSVDECARNGVRDLRRRHCERPARPMPCGPAEDMVLRSDEVGQHVAPAPAWVAEIAPVVEVVRVAPYDDHGVDRARSTQTLAALAENAAQRVAGLHCGRVGPVHLAVPEQRPLVRLAYHGRIGIATGLDQRHPAARVFRQAGGQHAAGRARTDNHDVRLAGHCVLPRRRRARPSSALRSGTVHLTPANT
jgi:hypothetical protein